MHSSRRTHAPAPLAIVLPHPQLNSRRSSLLSLNSAASPHTPRSCSSPLPPVYYQPSANRNSTDSWNSSNADDMDVEWKQEHVLLLSRTLDALPAHLVTPFNGSVPPSNLLDKIARGVSNAKGPAEWPYSIRATRVKLLELARSHAKEEALAEQRRHAIAEEVEINDDSNYSYFHNGEEKPLTGVGIAPRRPLYRQSSMDFIKPTLSEIKNNSAIAKLSSRLQRTDRIIPNPSYHPYSRIPRSQQANRRSSSPPHSNDVPALINQSSTPSSTTLDSFSTLSSSASAPRVLRRSASTLSSGSLLSTSSNGMSLADPRIQRVRRSDSFCSGPPAPPPKDTPTLQRAGFKRAPSYGALAQEARQEAMAAERVHARKLSGSYPSSDEEEKARTTRAKKAKTKVGAAVVSAPVPPSPSVVSPPSSAPPSPGTAPSSPVAVKTPTGATKPKLASAIPKPRLKGVAALAKEGEGAVKSPKANKLSSPASINKADGSASKSKTGKVDNKDNLTLQDNKAKSHPRARPPPMNLQRNPSMFGAELPPLRATTQNNNNAPRLPSSPPSAYRGPLAAPSKMRSPSPGAVRPLAPAATLSGNANGNIIGASALALAPAAPVLGPAVGAHACAYNSHVTRSPAVMSMAAADSTEPASPGPGALSPALTLVMTPEVSPKVRTLRRVRRLAPGGRRISFGSLVAPGEEGEAESQGAGLGLDVGARSPKGMGLLGSAFQLH
ncbi:hypothetical protein JR316_0006108 [Psilocybe cubensis]|uniref:Uncharacterized protein n=2 Tax=Psilocybe cubensis TaxID=181762 RepID=A0A8H7XYM0_PSICU|nr:hypothetical protein JR316_0006108 [Psilocybe cubensis]KAH9481581.1 hypothetical protein JR316_0006108 [Psilocybe cubensis]